MFPLATTVAPICTSRLQTCGSSTSAQETTYVSCSGSRRSHFSPGSTISVPRRAAQQHCQRGLVCSDKALISLSKPLNDEKPPGTWLPPKRQSSRSPGLRDKLTACQISRAGRLFFSMSAARSSIKMFPQISADTIAHTVCTDASRSPVLWVFFLFRCSNRSSYCTEPQREHIHIRKRAEFHKWGSFLRSSNLVCWLLLHILSPPAFHFRFVGRRKSQAVFQKVWPDVCEVFFRKEKKNTHTQTFV